MWRHLPFLLLLLTVLAPANYAAISVWQTQSENELHKVADALWAANHVMDALCRAEDGEGEKNEERNCQRSVIDYLKDRTPTGSENKWILGMPMILSVVLCVVWCALLFLREPHEIDSKRKALDEARVELDRSKEHPTECSKQAREEATRSADASTPPANPGSEAGP